MIILAIETSSNQGSVALRDGEKALWHEAITGGRNHSSLLFGALERALKVAQPERIAVGLGPGSYAGVRIAISAAVGLSLGTGAELVGVPSILALDDGEYRVIGDARRESFSYAWVRDGVCREGPLLFSEEALREKLAEAPKLPLYASERVAAFPEAVLRAPCALRLARLAAKEGFIHQRGALEPIYLREAYITLPKKNRPF